jgi:hypothetical protein
MELFENMLSLARVEELSLEGDDEGPNAAVWRMLADLQGVLVGGSNEAVGLSVILPGVWGRPASGR